MPKKLTYEHVKNYIEEQNYTLLSTEYKNSATKLKIQCNKYHIFEMGFNSFQQGKRCPECYGNKKLTYEFVKNYIQKENYQLLSNEYINIDLKLKIECDKGHEYLCCFNDFKNGKHRCPVCFGTKKYSYKFVKNYIEEQNYTLISKSYKNNKQKLIVKCDKGHEEYKVSFGSFKNSNHRCPKCQFDKISKGEKEILNHIQNIYSGRIIENDRTQIVNPLTNRNLELDIYLPDINKAIEYNGTYWHSIPYAIKKDRIKVNQCKELNIDLLIIKENNWLNNKERCIENINNFIY